MSILAYFLSLLLIGKVINAEILCIIYKHIELLQKWCATQVEQFKKVKENFGKTEMTAVAQAASINKSGLYEIGTIYRHSSEFKVCRINITNNATNYIFSTW